MWFTAGSPPTTMQGDGKIYMWVEQETDSVGAYNKQYMRTNH